MSDFNLQVNELIKKVKKFNYGELNDTFREALDKSLTILYNKAHQSLASTGWNINGNVSRYIKGKKNTYNSLSDGIIKEISNDATEGRVRIAAMKSKGYMPNNKDVCFVLPWVENGTDERFRGRTGAHRKKSYTKKKKPTGASTGSLKATSFFEKARLSSQDQMMTTLEESIDKAIQNIWNS